MKVVLLGSGNVATHLGKALQCAGHEILQVWSRTLTNARDLAIIVHAEFTDDLSQVISSAELYIVAVSDDAIEDVVSKVALRNRFVVHTSGSTGMEMMGISGVFYPVQTFSKRKKVDFSSIPIAIEAKTNEVKDLLSSVAKSLSTKVIELNSRQRRSLHIAAVFACNFSNHLYAIAGQMLEQENIEFDLIRPLIKETAEKALENLPALVQTGPAVRGDQSTVNKHLQHLENNGNLKELYRMLSQSIINFHQKR